MQNQVTTMPTAPAAPAYAATDATANIALMILQASNNPDIDVDKIEKMYQLYNAEAARLAELEFSTALAKLHNDIELMATDSKGQDSRYLTFETMNAKTKKPLYENGFSLYFEHYSKMNDWQTIQTKSGDTPIMLGCIEVKGILKHKTGLNISTSLTVPFDFSGSKKTNSAQAQGSALSYAKRYIMASLLKIATFDDDANFNRSNELVKLMPAQAQTITEIYNGLTTDKKAAFDNLLGGNGFSQITDIPKAWYNHFHTSILGIASGNQLTNNQGA